VQSPFRGVLLSPVRSTVLLVLAALLAAFVPLPADLVERWYSRGVYPVVQHVLTPASSLIPIALLDVSVAAGLVAWLVFVTRRWRARGVRAGVAAAARSLVAIAAISYLVFFAVWGLNYRRATLESKLAYDPSRVTRETTIRFAEAVVERLNALGASMHPGSSADRHALEAAFARAQFRVGASRTAVAAAPKRSVFSWYLLTAGIDGMMNPFFLEIILNPGILPVERPFSLAHEWAHLAGYANESEANFVAWLTCVEGDTAAQYSGWIEAFRYAVAALPRSERRALTDRLAPRVLADMRAINERLGRADPAVSGFARNVYDSYLRAQGIDEGIASYGAMLRLMLGTTFENGWVPRMRN
jgi:hypothetical protein